MGGMGGGWGGRGGCGPLLRPGVVCRDAAPHRQPAGPFIPGFETIPYNDLPALQAREGWAGRGGWGGAGREGKGEGRVCREQ